MSKIIEIKGIAFPNKGAELLLCEILQKVKSEYKVCLEPHGDYSNKVKYPIFTKVCLRFRGVNLLSLLSILPKYIRTRLGFVKPSEVDFVLDASGFAYGDDWSYELARNRILKENKPIIFLPQSFGPFKKKQSQEVIKHIVHNSSMTFAREKKGQLEVEHATQEKIEVVRDITFGLKVTPNSIERDLLIIPNFQVLKREGQVYLDKLQKIIESNESRKITLVNHEGPKDREIIDILAAKNKSDIEIIDGVDGPQLKSIIGSSKFVVTSRYHGLISALSQRIPVIALGWSFKYEEILNYFEIPTSTDVEIINSYIQAPEYEEIFKSDKFASRLKKLNAEIDEMWRSVLKFIDES